MHHKLKKIKKIGTWNVRSLYKGQIELVMREMKRTDVKQLGLSEVRWMGRDCTLELETRRCFPLDMIRIKQME